MVKNFNNADEVRPDKTKAEVVELGNVAAMKISSRDGDGRMHQAGGWNRTCQKRHVGMLVSEMKVVNDDGSEAVVNAGDAYVFEPGHDGWVIEDEPAVGYEFEGSTAATYAKSLINLGVFGLPAFSFPERSLMQKDFPTDLHHREDFLLERERIFSSMTASVPLIRKPGTLLWNSWNFPY